MEQITPTRKPLFGGSSEQLEQKVQKPATPFTKSEFKPKPVSTGSNLFGNTKLLISFGVIFVAVVTIIVVLVVGSGYSSDVAQKSSLLLPFLWRNKSEN